MIESLIFTDIIDRYRFPTCFLHETHTHREEELVRSWSTCKAWYRLPHLFHRYGFCGLLWESESENLGVWDKPCLRCLGVVSVYGCSGIGRTGRNRMNHRYWRAEPWRVGGFTCIRPLWHHSAVFQEHLRMILRSFVAPWSVCVYTNCVQWC